MAKLTGALGGGHCNRVPRGARKEGEGGGGVVSTVTSAGRTGRINGYIRYMVHTCMFLKFHWKS